MVSKNTIDELLGDYLSDLGLDDKNIKEMKKNIHKSAKVRKKVLDKKTRELQKKREVSEKKSNKISHGTSCPRIMNQYGELVVEM